MKEVHVSIIYSGKEGRNKMLFHFGFLLVLAAAANGQDGNRRVGSHLAHRFHFTTPRIPTIPVAAEPERDIVRWVPIYGQRQPDVTANQTQALGSTVAQPSQDLDFNCPKQYGYYRYEQTCEIYVECMNYQASRKVCPDGMFFKENPSWSEYPCAQPPEAQCLNRKYKSNNQDRNQPSHFTTQRIPKYPTTLSPLPTQFKTPITLKPESREPTYGSGDLTGGFGGDIAQLSQNWDFTCSKRYAFYRYEQNCDIYVECRNFQPTRKVCPDGMHFKESPLWSEYPCAYPPEAQCLSREFALPARPTAECPLQFGNYPLAVERYPTHDSCSSYISCASGVAHVMNCTFGLVFNPAINLCDWPEQVPGCQDTFDFRCPVPHLGEEDMVINYRYPQDPECRYFFSCLNGSYRVLACDEGLLFDHRIGRCVEYDDFICDN